MSSHPKLPITSVWTVACLSLSLLVACADDDVGSGGDETETGEGTETSSPGDGDPATGDGDGDPTTSGDGDGDPTTTGDGDGDPTTGDGDGDPTTGDGDGDPGDSTLRCLDMQFVNGPSPGPDYKEFPNVPIGSHCFGTNNQDITEIDRVVFVGDSVTVGSPPAGPNDFYRVQLAEALADKFGLYTGNILEWEQWKNADPFNGTTIKQESGDFASCAKWGARNDDLIGQLQDCISGDDFQQRTLVVWTSGGNDINSVAQDAIAGAPVSQLFDETEAMIDWHHQALDWLLGDPDKFPNGVFVVTANVYEFTDFTSDVLSCPAADLAGYEANPPNPQLMVSSLTMINERYMEMAEEFGVDLMFMFEHFCGHGFKHDEPDNVCYRGPGNDNWFDLTCIHPSAYGHGQIADMFSAVIEE